MSIQARSEHRGNCHYLYDSTVLAETDLAALFDDSEAHETMQGGRSSVKVVRYRDREYVLRHYQRGGLLRRLSGDRYLWTGLISTRAFREWRLLAALFSQNLPVPRPAATRVVRHGLVYRADLITARLPADATLAAYLSKRPLSPQCWRGLGMTLRRFHAVGVFHPDLNANNVMLDASGSRQWLIDFDRAGHRAPAPGWQRRNLARLRRSLDKLAGRGAMHYDDKDWQLLVQSYASSRDGNKDDACNSLR